AKKAVPRNIYGDEISAYIEECRQFVARARRQEVVIEDGPGVYRLGAAPKANGKRRMPAAAAEQQQEAAEHEQSLRKLEADLTKREVELIEREIKLIGMQHEIDQLRPLSGLYRVVKAMATERKLESLLDVITRETQQILKCDRCSVFVLEPKTQELWT